MKWTKVSDYCIQSGEYRISKYVLGGEALYIVWCEGSEIGTAASGNEARKIATDHVKREAGHGKDV